MLQPGPPTRHVAVRGPYEGNAYAVSEGKRLYNQFNCSGCHFQGGGGIGPPLMDAEWIYGSAPGEHLRDHRRGPAQRHAVLPRQDRHRPDLAARGLRALDERPAGARTSPPAATTTCRCGARSSRTAEGEAASRGAAARRARRAPAMSAFHRSAAGQARGRCIVDRLWDPMFAMAVVTFVLVVAALLWAAFRRRRAGRAEPGRPGRRARRWRAVVGVGARRHHASCCSSSSCFDISVGRAITANPGKRALQIRVTGHQWWWEVQYRDTVAAALGHHRQRDPHPGRPAGGDRAPLDRRHPQLLAAEPQRQAGPDPGQREQRSGSGPTAPASTGASAPSSAATSTPRWRSRSSPSRPDSFAALARRRSATRPARRPTPLTQRGQEVFLGSTCVDVPRHRRHAGGEPRRSRPDPPREPAHDRRGHAAETRGGT